MGAGPARRRPAVDVHPQAVRAVQGVVDAGREVGAGAVGVGLADLALDEDAGRSAQLPAVGGDGAVRALGRARGAGPEAAGDAVRAAALALLADLAELARIAAPAAVGWV